MLPPFLAVKQERSMTVLCETLVKFNGMGVGLAATWFCTSIIQRNMRHDLKSGCRSDFVL